MIAEIRLTQNPVIEHALAVAGKSVTERLSALNIENQIATSETIQALKSLRAELNKEAKNFEEQRKIIKDAILNPYNDFEAIYKVEIIEKYKSADEVLKGKINDFEMKLKQKKRENLIAYFKESNAVNDYDFVRFENAVPDVNLSTTERAYMGQINDFFKKVDDDMALIETQNWPEEILVIYKKTLNASAAIREVKDRKDAEKKERDRMLADRQLKRLGEIRGMGFLNEDMLRSYVYANEKSITLRWSELETADEDEWDRKVVELRRAISDWKSKQPIPGGRRQAEIFQAPTVEIKPAPAPVDETIAVAPMTEPVPAVAETKETPELYDAKFLVTNEPYERMMMLKAFLTENNFNYINID